MLTCTIAAPALPPPLCRRDKLGQAKWEAVLKNHGLSPTEDPPAKHRVMKALAGAYSGVVRAKKRASADEREREQAAASKRQAVAAGSQAAPATCVGPVVGPPVARGGQPAGHPNTPQAPREVAAGQTPTEPTEAAVMEAARATEAAAAAAAAEARAASAGDVLMFQSSQSAESTGQHSMQQGPQQGWWMGVGG